MKGKTWVWIALGVGVVGIVYVWKRHEAGKEAAPAELVAAAAEGESGAERREGEKLAFEEATVKEGESAEKEEREQQRKEEEERRKSEKEEAKEDRTAEREEANRREATASAERREEHELASAEHREAGEREEKKEQHAREAEERQQAKAAPAAKASSSPAVASEKTQKPSNSGHVNEEKGNPRYGQTYEIEDYKGEEYHVYHSKGKTEKFAVRKT